MGPARRLGLSLYRRCQKGSQKGHDVPKIGRRGRKIRVECEGERPDHTAVALSLENATSIPVDLGVSAGMIDSFAPSFIPLGAAVAATA